MRLFSFYGLFFFLYQSFLALFLLLSPTTNPVAWAAAGAAVSSAPPLITRQELTARQAGIVVRYLVSEGQLVKKGTVLVELDNRAIRAAIREAQAAKEVAQANEDLAQDAVNRLRELKKSDAATEQQLVEGQIKLAQARAGRKQAEAVRTRLEVQLEDTLLKAEIPGIVRGLPTILGLAVQAGQSLGRIEVTNK